VAPELDDPRQLAALVIGAVDGFSSGFVHDEHALSGWDGDGQKGKGLRDPRSLRDRGEQWSTSST
jgi:hypothetical protein